MKPYKILFTKQAKKDVNSLTPKLKKKLREILTNLIAVDPFVGKKLLGELEGNYSYRLSLKDRIIYSVDKKKHTIYIKRTRTHYGD
jgi:mRNA-degrading endonuclease RelE of RelBE toxin-antitoxin system